MSLQYELYGRQNDGAGARRAEMRLSAAPPTDGGHVARSLRPVVQREPARTPLRRAQQEAAARASQLEAILGATPDGVLVVDQDRSAVLTNLALRTMLGLEGKADLVSLPPRERSRLFRVSDTFGQPVPDEQRPTRRVLRGEVLIGEGAGEYRIRTLDGRELFVSVTAAPIRDGSGHVTGGVLVLRDVTDRQRRERRTQDVLTGLVAMAEALVETPLETPTDRTAASSVHGGGAHSPANQTAQRLVTLAQSILGGQRIGLIAVDWDTGAQRPVATVRPTPDEEREWWASVPRIRVYEYVDAALVARLGAGEVVLLDPPQGPARMVLGGRMALAAPMRVREQLVGLLVVNYAGVEHEVTAEERAVAGAVAKLAALALERERLLQEQAAVGAHASALEAANQQMDEFLGIAAHELKAPVTTSTLAVQMAASRLKNRIGRKLADRDEQAGQLIAVEELLARADHSMARLGRLMINLLDVVGIRAGKLDMRLEPCDLADIVRDALDEERQLVPTRAIRLHLPARRSVPVIADATRIGEVVTNYLSNAVKYSPDQAPVTVQLRIEGEWARVSVRDKGPGLSAKEQEHLWERFHRVPGIHVASGSGLGLGLGLHICKTIVEQHHGHVGVRSAPGRGSTFWFTLPVDPARA